MEERKDNENDQLISSSVWPLGAPDNKKVFSGFRGIYKGVEVDQKKGLLKVF